MQTFRKALKQQPFPAEKVDIVTVPACKDVGGKEGKWSILGLSDIISYGYKLNWLSSAPCLAVPGPG